MEYLNRTALLVTPKRRFFEWVGALPEIGDAPTYDERRSLASVYLVGGSWEDAEIGELVDDYWEDLFDDMLAGWAGEALWPPNRTPHTFRDWFDVEAMHSVVDVEPQEPLTHAELRRTRCAQCEATLGDEPVNVAILANSTARWTSAQYADWERFLNRWTGGEDVQPPMDDVTGVLRCCSEACAAAVEEVMRREREFS